METSTNKYRLYLFTYGILSLLKVLDHFVSEEKYEECKKIVDAIKEQNSRLGLDLPTALNKEVYAMVMEEFNRTDPKVDLEWLENSTDYYKKFNIKRNRP